MLYSLVKQETFNFNNFISTKYIALYFTNVLEGIFVELHDKIILNILSKTSVLIYSEKKNPSETQNVGFKFLPGLPSVGRGEGHHCGGNVSSCHCNKRCIME